MEAVLALRTSHHLTVYPELLPCQRCDTFRALCGTPPDLCQVLPSLQPIEVRGSAGDFAKIVNHTHRPDGSLASIRDRRNCIPEETCYVGCCSSAEPLIEPILLSKQDSDCLPVPAQDREVQGGTTFQILGPGVEGPSTAENADDVDSALG